MNILENTSLPHFRLSISKRYGWVKRQHDCSSNCQPSTIFTETHPRRRCWNLNWLSGNQVQKFNYPEFHKIFNTKTADNEKKIGIFDHLLCPALLHCKCICPTSDSWHLAFSFRRAL